MRAVVAGMCLILLGGCSLFVSGPKSGYQPENDGEPNCTRSQVAPELDLGLGIGFTSILLFEDIREGEELAAASFVAAGVGLLVSAAVGYSKVRKCRVAHARYFVFEEHARLDEVQERPPVAEPVDARDRKVDSAAGAARRERRPSRSESRNESAKPVAEAYLGFERVYDQNKQRTTVRFRARLNSYTVFSAYYRYPGKRLTADATPQPFLQFEFTRPAWTFREEHTLSLILGSEVRSVKSKWFGDVHEHGVIETIVGRLDDSAMVLFLSGKERVTVKLGEFSMALPPDVSDGIRALLKPVAHMAAR